MSARPPQFAVCIDNKGYSASLERGKIYQIIADKAALAHGYLRVMDECGEDYAYTANRFSPWKFPENLGALSLLPFPGHRGFRSWIQSLHAPKPRLAHSSIRAFATPLSLQL